MQVLRRALEQRPDIEACFFDFASLYQNKPQPRTAEQDAAFKRALGGMSMWYALKP